MSWQAPSPKRLVRITIRPKGHATTRPAPTVIETDEVKSLEELATKYGLAPADELAGPDSSRLYFDYGSPAVLADSSSGAKRTKREDALWSRALGH